MPKRTLKQITPSAAKLREIKSLKLLGEWIYEPRLWHINRYSASMAFFVGLFVAFMPIPGQMVLAAALAYRLRCNLPLSVGLVWITNPATIPAIFFLSYKVGAMIVDVPMQEMAFELSFTWLFTGLGDVWQPFLLGCVICGLFFGSLGYFVISMLWRIRVGRQWQKRKLLRKEKRSRHQGTSD